MCAIRPVHGACISELADSMHFVSSNWCYSQRLKLLSASYHESSRRVRSQRSVSRQCARSGAKNPSQRPRPWPNAARLQSLLPPLLSHKQKHESVCRRWSDDKDSHALRPHMDTVHTVIREDCALASLLSATMFGLLLMTLLCSVNSICFAPKKVMCGTKISVP